MKILHTITTTVIALMIGLGFCAGAPAAEGALAGYEVAFLDMINEARANPLETAREMGMDPERIIRDFPEMETALTEGLPPLTFDRNLYEAARAHTEEMLAEGYYAHDSADGRTYEDRIRDAGYLPLASGESLGLVAFSNFVDPAERVRTIFETMFRDQLDPASGETMYILSPELTQVGIALGAGTMQWGKALYNVYLATCDFGRSVETVSMEIVHLINQARYRPLDVISSLGMDPDQVLADRPELTDILTNGLPPLTVDLLLYAAAAVHAGDMLEEGYFSHDSPEGETFRDRIAEAGYDPEVAGESLGMSYYRPDEELPLDRAQGLLYDLFLCELEEGADRAILNPDLRDVGVGLIAGESEPLATICSDHILFMVADFAAPAGADESVPRLVGVAYEDRNGDLLYDRSEGLGGLAVGIEGETFSGVVYTGESGGFSTALPPGAYRISCEWGDARVSEAVEITESSVSVFLRVPPMDDGGGEEGATE